ncbi:hypothetical protein GGI20_001454 [Coemansia sp. BCRC 34301]|nr:hypothetical protein GGI20_001454 [Coemansia sp. BCRC 34301]
MYSLSIHVFPQSSAGGYFVVRFLHSLYTDSLKMPAKGIVHLSLQARTDIHRFATKLYSTTLFLLHTQQHFNDMKFQEILIAFIALFVCIVAAQGSGTGTDAAATPTSAATAVSAGSQVTIGQVVLSFITGLLTIVGNTVRGYLALPPVA